MNLALVSTLGATNLELLINDATARLASARSLDDDAAALNAPQTVVTRTWDDEPADRAQENAKQYTFCDASTCSASKSPNQSADNNPNKYHTVSISLRSK